MPISAAISTNVGLNPSSISSGSAISKQQNEGALFKPVVNTFASTVPSGPELVGDTTIITDQEPLKTFIPPVLVDLPPIDTDSTPLQIWEGNVVEVDHDASVMHVILDAKMVQIPRHTAEIELKWVAEQDRDLVCLGAIFYLTLFKRTKRGSVENTQELRFRRRPSWSTAQLKKVDENAAMLLSKMKTLPTSE